MAFVTSQTRVVPSEHSYARKDSIEGQDFCQIVIADKRRRYVVQYKFKVTFKYGDY